jgi:hypothetical protein
VSPRENGNQFPAEIAKANYLPAKKIHALPAKIGNSKTQNVQIHF